MSGPPAALPGGTSHCHAECRVGPLSRLPPVLLGTRPHEQPMQELRRAPHGGACLPGNMRVSCQALHGCSCSSCSPIFRSLRTRVGHGAWDYVCAHVVASRPLPMLRQNQPAPWVWRNYLHARLAIATRARCWGMMDSKHTCCLAHALHLAGVIALLSPRWLGRITETRQSW